MPHIKMEAFFKLTSLWKDVNVLAVRIYMAGSE